MKLLKPLSLFTLCLTAPFSITANNDPGIYFVPNVVDQFNSLALRPEALGFSIGNSPDPTMCRHYQGIVRSHGTGTPYFFVSRSGNRAAFPEEYLCEGIFTSDDEPGNLLIVQMGSRDTNGERLRSNRLVRDWDINGSDKINPDVIHPEIPFWPTPPDDRDTTVSVIDFDGQDGWPNYGHPGGMQLIDDVLAVPLEHPYDDSDPDNLIVFIDVSDPEHPTLLSPLNPRAGDEFSAGLLAITPILTSDKNCCRYLMIVTGKSNKAVRLFKSSPTRADGTTDLKSRTLNWASLGDWTEADIESCLSGQDWPTGRAMQMMNFVRETNMNGDLYMITARNTSRFSGDDRLYLYQINEAALTDRSQCLFTYESFLHVTSKPIIGGGDSANLQAAAGAYVSPSGELIVYASEFENNGPWEVTPEGNAGKRTVRMVEYRHHKMVRPDSPTLKPSIKADSPYRVDEGSSVSLNAMADQPITKAWLQLFEEPGLGDDLDGDWLAVDIDDWGKDNFDDMKELHFSDKASSWRWFAHSGCNLRVNDADTEDDSFPGEFSLILAGSDPDELDPFPNEVSDLSVLLINNQITSMGFEENCDDYYNAAINVAWDLDENGSFETTSHEPVYDATGVDGPDTVIVQARGEHPTDTTILGMGSPISVPIHINNVPPIVESFGVFDAFGFKVGVDIPFVFVNLSLSAAATFTDPGRPDTQVATLDWDDGMVDPSAKFDTFSDASGGVIGVLEQQHIYSMAGTYSVQLDVADDDGGRSDATLAVEVVSPVDALESIVEALDQILATTTSPDEYIAALLDTRNNLAGNNVGAGNNGAIEKLASEEPRAALTMIEAALEALQRAESAGSVDLSSLKRILGLTAEAIAQAVYLEVVTATGMPSRGEAKQLQRIQQSITDGHALLLSGDYLAAIEMYQAAVGRANKLIT